MVLSFLLILISFYVLVTCTTATVDGFLFENGTCSNQTVSKMSNKVVNTSGTVDDFLKSLPRDNTILAEMVCQYNQNETK
jgi:hypothetical protein